ncbi:VOC family protein [Rhizobium sp. Root483D2]|jgi:predicted enzyme related to lactoylglutathione lyase|uniref:VOC family protein n=1 Tax=Rhizobium sp. Root483D2 TaxID=1736545 RepID=UPI000712A756|nr:VOC family protein [Rhizobium sp. Root483D2]KQY34000.1 glyoxalase [Rhizobium sp. Root483D2]
MKKGHGAFVWYELMTTDTKAAETFYDDVVGWTSADSGMPDADYTLFKTNGLRVAGLMTLPQSARDMNVPPAWLGYIGVDDVDASAEKLVKLGGTVHRQPDDIPGVGRFAVVADPHGAVFALFSTSDGEMPDIKQMDPGSIGWHELMAGDIAVELPFYQEMFGWQKDDGLDMGDMGIYQLFSHDGAQIGGMMNKLAAIPAPPYWGFYFNVDALDAAIDRSNAKGGKVVNGPMEVPGGAWVVNCVDPQGAHFNLVAMKR